MIGISTNDALGGAAKNIGALMNYKNYYFVPFAQDDAVNKPRSLVCRFSLVHDTVEAAYDGYELDQKLL